MNRQCYEFQPPANLKAIRSNIVERIKQKTRKQEEESSIQKVNDYLDNGLPSPPCETYSFEQEKLVELNTPVNNICSPSSTLDSPPSPVPSSCSTSTLASSEAIREKIKLLKQEKHELFQTMKNLLSVSAPSTPITSSLPSIDVPKSKQKPVVRSRSVSHTEFSKPRYYRPPSRHYRPMYSQPPFNNSQMSRRLSMSSSYIPQRSTSTSLYRSPNPRLERHSRY